MNSRRFKINFKILSRPAFGVCCGGILMLAMAAAATSASGYVLQGPHILDLMVQALAKAKTLEVEQIVTIDDPDLSDHSVTVFETLTYGYPDRFRVDTRSEQAQRISLAVRGEHVLVEEGRWRIHPPNRLDRYKDLLLLNSRPMLQRVLLNYGVDVGISSLGRFENRIVYVIGARYPDESVSQIWVDKENFFPLRWLTTAPGNPSADMEFIYRNWQKTGDLWYPAQIEIYLQRRLIRSLKAEKIRVNSELPAGIWDIGYLKANYPSAALWIEPKRPEPEVNEAQEALESFQKKFEP